MGHDPQRAFDYVVKLRLSDGKIISRRCSSEKNYFINTRRIRLCRGCNKQFTLKVNTIFEDSPLTPLEGCKRCMKRGKHKRPKKKKSAWTLSTVLSLILTAVGLVALVELKARIQVTPQPALKSSEAFSAPFLITNTGYLSFTAERTFCYIHHLEVPGIGTISEGAVVPQGGYPAEAQWGATLEPGGNETLMCKIEASPLRAKADIAIVVDYRPLGVPHTFRHYERFVGEAGDNWQWVHQPMTEAIEKKADALLEKYVPPNR